jgi:hypothetical protein
LSTPVFLLAGQMIQHRTPRVDLAALDRGPLAGLGFDCGAECEEGLSAPMDEVSARVTSKSETVHKQIGSKWLIGMVRPERLELPACWFEAGSPQQTNTLHGFGLIVTLQYFHGLSIRGGAMGHNPAGHGHT